MMIVRDGDAGARQPAAEGAAGRIWRPAEVDPARIAQLAWDFNLPRAAAAVLAARNLPDIGAIRRFLSPALENLGNPLNLPGMPAAVERIWRAVDDGEEIVIFGDYDADGITSVALLLQVLGELGAASVTPCLANRLQAGYGFTPSALERCRQSGRPSLIITVDTGITSAETCALAAAAGVDVVVTDHHEPGGVLPPAAAVVDPKLGEDAAACMLAGVGVVYQLCRAMAAAGRPAAAGLDLRAWLDLVMLGTVADIVPLLEDNRILVRHGLNLLHSIGRVGLQALIDRAGLPPEINAGHVAFGLAPRLNAIGRMQTPEPALELLLTEDPARAAALADALDSANRARQEIETRIFNEASAGIDLKFDPADQFGLVAAQEDWHPGVIGIVAARLAARYRRPVVVVAFDGGGLGRGSARGIEGCNLLECLRECSGCLEACGGHASAAGLALRRADLPAFRTAFNAAAGSRLRGMDLRPVQRVDAWVELPDLNEELLLALDQLQPYGQSHPAPVLAARRLRVEGSPRIVGARHVKFAVTDGNVRQEAIAFGRAGTPLPQGTLDLAFQLQRNTWQGATTLQLNVQDWRPAAG